ncbi:hypothetical protein GCM10023188_47900 [Pontibacter saemangeumensis]|uniref:Uncharacterized protein n=1 Tax=Pontibacter saemangeumensis TaxID=1084525 RepID=A0ABP8M900_9BACT
MSGEVTLQVKLTSRFSLRTNFNYPFEDEPVVPNTRFVYAVSNGVQVQFCGRSIIYFRFKQRTQTIFT